MKIMEGLILIEVFGNAKRWKDTKYSDFQKDMNIYLWT